MLLLNDRQIKALHIGDDSEDMINPFIGEQVRIKDDMKCVSYGLSSVGYDIRLGNQIKVPLMEEVGDILDPHFPASVEYDDFIAEDFIDIQPGHMVLGASLEDFRMPSDVCAICLGKSTYARLGLFVNVTPLEPSWAGTLTMELSNIGHLPVRVYVGEGIAQLLFFRIERPITTYADKGGKYQDQRGVTTAKL